MRTLARAWACDASNVTWMVDRLESRGLVERRMLPGDRRVKMVALTPLGAGTKAELFTRLHEPPADFLALDRATLQVLRDALARLPASLRATGPHERPPDGMPPHHSRLEAALGTPLASRMLTHQPGRQPIRQPALRPAARRRQGAS